MQRTHGISSSVALARMGRAPIAVFGLFAAAAAATAMVDSETASAIMAGAVVVGLVGAGLGFITRAESLDVEERHAWKLVGAGLLIAATGVVAFVITWFLSPTVGTFGPPDLLFLLGYFVGLWGFATLPHTYGSSLHRLRLLLDAVIGAVAVGTLLWVLLLKDLTDTLRAAPTWERLVGSSYVLLDVALLVVVMIVVVRRSNLRFDLRLMLFGLASICQAAADITFLIRGAGRSFAQADPIYVLHIMAAALFVLTASIVDRVPREREYADRTTAPAWAMVVPYGLAALMIVLLVSRFSAVDPSATDRALMYATLLVGGLVIARQAVAIRENRRTVEGQRTDLVASISHELRTPLTAVVGFLEILDHGDLKEDNERREITTIACQQASYLSRIVSDLLMLASENTTALELDVVPTAVDELAWASINAAAVDPTSVRVDAERGTTAFLDTGRMQQAIANLLANAARYGGDQVLVVAKADSGALVVEVHDDGPGVPRKHELMIWEKFERGPNRLNATVPGSGIGLAITNAIAKAHGGSVGYHRSERLGGACFWIRLPGRVHTDSRYRLPEGSAKLAVVDSPRDAQSA